VTITVFAVYPDGRREEIGPDEDGFYSPPKDALFDKIASNVGTEGAIRAAFHRLLAEQHQERARWTNPQG
jgi:hypothetical protein